jgi:hypothetical protein
MPELSIDCVSAEPEPYAAAPTVQFILKIAETSGVRVHTIALRCQLRIEPQRRAYSGEETRRLSDLFGEPARWGDTLHAMQLATVGVMVPGFSGSVQVPMPVACTADTEVATAKYFHGLDDGDIPLLMLFSGTVFYRADAGVQVAPVPWRLELSHRLPLRVWRSAMDQHFPGSTWLPVRVETMHALQRYRAEHDALNWDDTLAGLLAETSRRAEP